MLNILRSLRKNISSYNIMGRRLNDRYDIENLYFQISEPYDIHTKVDDITITYLTPNRLYGKIFRFGFDKVDEIIRVTSSYIFPERRCETYNDPLFLSTPEYEERRRDDMLNYIERDKIMKNEYLISDRHIKFYTKRNCDINLYAMDNGNKYSRRNYFIDYDDSKYYSTLYRNNVNYEREIRLNNNRSIKIFGICEEDRFFFASKINSSLMILL
jgi:hypothetical protein